MSERTFKHGFNKRGNYLFTHKSPNSGNGVIEVTEKFPDPDIAIVNKTHRKTRASVSIGANVLLAGGGIGIAVGDIFTGLVSNPPDLPKIFKGVGLLCLSAYPVYETLDSEHLRFKMKEDIAEIKSFKEGPLFDVFA